MKTHISRRAKESTDATDIKLEDLKAGIVASISEKANEQIEAVCRALGVHKEDVVITIVDELKVF